MTLTFELDLDSVTVNRHAKCRVSLLACYVRHSYYEIQYYNSATFGKGVLFSPQFLLVSRINEKATFGFS